MAFQGEGGYQQPQHPPIGQQPFNVYSAKRRREVSSDVVFYDYDYGSENPEGRKENSKREGPPKEEAVKGQPYSNYASDNARFQQNSGQYPEYPPVQSQSSVYGYNNYLRNNSLPPPVHHPPVPLHHPPVPLHQSSSHAFNNYPGNFPPQNEHYQIFDQNGGYGCSNYPTSEALQQQTPPVAQDHSGGYGYQNYENYGPATSFQERPSSVQEFPPGAPYVMHHKPPVATAHVADMQAQTHSYPNADFSVHPPFQKPTGYNSTPSEAKQATASVTSSETRSCKEAPLVNTALRLKAPPPPSFSSSAKVKVPEKIRTALDYANYGQMDKPISGPSGNKLDIGQSSQASACQKMESVQTNEENRSGNEKSKVFTGIVTKVQENFGMIGDDVFFQRSAVKGPFPKLGDRVLVEAEMVTAMPFKWNSKRVQLVNKDLSTPNNPISTPKIRNIGEEIVSPYGYGVAKAAPPPPTITGTVSMANSTFPSVGQLKSILKNSSLARNPPPPPVISKLAVKQPNTNVYNPGSPEPVDFRSSTFELPFFPGIATMGLGVNTAFSALDPHAFLSNSQILYNQRQSSSSPRRISRSPSLRRKRLPPPRRRRSSSPRRRRSSSPRQKRRSPSPRRAESPSPRGSRLSSSPRRTAPERSSSPKRRHLLPSRRSYRSPSPNRRRRSISSRSNSPVLGRYRRLSPLKRNRSPSPNRKKLSKSPDPFDPSLNTQSDKMSKNSNSTLGQLALNNKNQSLNKNSKSLNASPLSKIDSIMETKRIATFLEAKNLKPISFPIRASAPRVPLLPNPAYMARSLVPYPVQSVLPNPLHPFQNLSNMINVNTTTGKSNNEQPPPTGVSATESVPVSLSPAGSQPLPPGEDTRNDLISILFNKSTPVAKTVKQQMMIVIPMKKHDSNSPVAPVVPTTKSTISPTYTPVGQSKTVSTLSTPTPIDVSNSKKKSKSDNIQAPAYTVKPKAKMSDNTNTVGDSSQAKGNTSTISPNVEKVLTELRKKIDNEKSTLSKKTANPLTDKKVSNSDKQQASSKRKSTKSITESNDKILNDKNKKNEDIKPDETNTSKIWVTDFSKICVVDIEDETPRCKDEEEDSLHQTFLDEEQRLMQKDDWNELEKLREEEDRRLRFKKENRLQDLRDEEAKLITIEAPQKDIEQFKITHGSFKARWAEEQRLITIREEEERLLRENQPDDPETMNRRRRMLIEKEKAIRREEYKRKLHLNVQRESRGQEFIRYDTPPRHRRRTFSVEKGRHHMTKSLYEGHGGSHGRSKSPSVKRSPRRSRSPSVARSQRRSHSPSSGRLHRLSRSPSFGRSHGRPRSPSIGRPQKRPSSPSTERSFRRSRSRSSSRSRQGYRARRFSKSPPRHRSRRVSYEEYRRERREQCSSRSRSRDMEYEEFVERTEGTSFNLNRNVSGDSGSDVDKDQEIEIAKALETVRRKREELDKREREIEARLKDTASLLAKHERINRVQRYPSGNYRAGGRY